MSATRLAIVGQARAWVGCNETDGSFKQIIDTYNQQKNLPRGYPMKYTDEWCAAFVSAVSQKCNALDIVLPECGCGKMVALYKARGEYVENDAFIPQPADIIFYDWEDSGNGDDTNLPDHVGIVESVSNGSITVIEGNNSSEVRRRTIPINGKYICGFATPKYAQEQPTSAPQKNIADIAKEVIAGKWGNGQDRASRLQAAGYNYSAVQSVVNSLMTHTAPTPAKLSNTEIAKQVIRGSWGNGQDRANRLQAAGYNYSEIQKIVNQLCR